MILKRTPFLGSPHPVAAAVAAIAGEAQQVAVQPAVIQPDLCAATRGGNYRLAVIDNVMSG